MRIMLSVALTVAFGFMVSTAQAGEKGGFRKLFNGKNLDGWKIFMKNKKANVEEAISVEDGIIKVSGKGGNGFFYTEKPYSNYVIRYTWSYPKDQPKGTTMNSGFLMHIQEPLKVWPKSVEPQCRYKDHGKIYFIGSKGTQKFDMKAQKKALKPSHEWNTTEVVANGDGSFEVRINGTLVNSGTSNLKSGPIGFQAEGARIHFKEILIKNID